MKFIPKKGKKRTNSGLPNLHLGKRVIELPLYSVWNTMRQRCYNPTVKSYHRYGGRGIKVCKQWRESFMAFYEWAMKNGYKKGLSIDRKNNNGNYCPSNCRIATKKQQARNTRKSKYVIWENKPILLIKLCEKFNCRYGIVNGRIKKGWDLKRALTTPILTPQQRKKRAIIPIEDRGTKTDLTYNARMGQKYPVYLNVKGSYVIKKISPSGITYEYNISKFKHMLTKNN